MIGDERSPGPLARLLSGLPDGFFLRIVFVAMIGVAAAIVTLDYRDRVEASIDLERVTRSQPLPLKRPEPGDQIRPYLPKTIPVSPDRGEPTLPDWTGPVDGEAMAAPMRFVAGPGGAISAVGRIDPGTEEAFADFLDSPAAADADTLYIHSPGGSVDEAIRLARRIRAAHLSTAVPADGYCASACPLVLAGGVTRHAGRDAWIGVHQVYAVALPGVLKASEVDQSIADIQDTIARCQQLLAEMGVDPAVWVKAMRTPPDSLYVLTGKELAAFRMVRRFPDDGSFIGPPAPVIPTFPKIAAPAGRDEQTGGGAEAEPPETAAAEPSGGNPDADAGEPGTAAGKSARPVPAPAPAPAPAVPHPVIPTASPAAARRG